jgi:hypothetical protein
MTLLKIPQYVFKVDIFVIVMVAISHWESCCQNIIIFLRFFENSSDELGTGNTRHFRKSIVNDESDEL